MGVHVSIINDTDSEVHGHVQLLGGTNVLGWGFTLAPSGQDGHKFEKKDGGLMNGAPYICKVKVDVDGDGKTDTVLHRFTAKKDTILVVSKMLQESNIKFTGGDITLVEAVKCSLRESRLQYYGGKLYIHTDRLYFDSKFTKSHDYEIPMTRIHALAKKTDLRQPNAIKVSVKKNENDKEAFKEFYFTGFADRDRIFSTIARVLAGKQTTEFTQASAAFQSNFKLHSSEVILRYYHCDFHKVNTKDRSSDTEKISGTMYISPNFVCFYSATVTDKIKGVDILEVKESDVYIYESKRLHLKVNDGIERIFDFSDPVYKDGALAQLQSLLQEWRDEIIDKNYRPNFADHDSFFIASAFDENLVLEIRSGVAVILNNSIVIGDAMVLAERTGKSNQKFVMRNNRIRSCLESDEKSDYWQDINTSTLGRLRDGEYENMVSFIKRVNIEVQSNPQKRGVRFLVTKGAYSVHPGLSAGEYKVQPGARIRRYLGIERVGPQHTHHPGIQASLIRTGARVELGAPHGWLGRRGANGKTIRDVGIPGQSPGPMQEWRVLNEFDSFMAGMLSPLIREMKVVAHALSFSDRLRAFEARTQQKLSILRASSHKLLWEEIPEKQADSKANTESSVSYWRPRVNQGEVFFGDICLAAHGLKELNDRDVGVIAKAHPLLLPPVGYTLVCSREIPEGTIGKLLMTPSPGNHSNPLSRKGARSKGNAKSGGSDDLDSPIASDTSASPPSFVRSMSKLPWARKSEKQCAETQFLHLWKPIPPVIGDTVYHSLGCVVTIGPEPQKPTHLDKYLRCVPETLLLEFTPQTKESGVLGFAGRALEPQGSQKNKTVPFATFRNLGVNTFECTKGEIPSTLKFRFAFSEKELQDMVRVLSDFMVNLVETCARALDSQIQEDEETKTLQVNEFTDGQLADLVKTLRVVVNVIRDAKDAKTPGSITLDLSRDSSLLKESKLDEIQISDLAGKYCAPDKSYYSIDTQGYIREIGDPEKEHEAEGILFLEERPFAQLKLLPAAPPAPSMVKLIYLADDSEPPVTGEMTSAGIVWEDGDEWERWRQENSSADVMAELNWITNHLGRFRDAFVKYGKEGFMEKMMATTQKFGHIRTKLQRYYPEKIQRCVAAVCSVGLPPPSAIDKRKAELAPPIAIDLGNPEGGPVGAGWIIREDTPLQAVGTVYLKSYKTRLASPGGKGRGAKAVPGTGSGDRFLSLHLLEKESEHPCVFGKSYGVDSDGKEIWAAKGAAGRFELTCESKDARTTGRTQATLSIKLGGQGCVKKSNIAIERTDLPSTRMYHFQAKFFDVGPGQCSDTNPAAHYISVTGFLLDGSSIEHRVGFSPTIDNYYCLSSPDLDFVQKKKKKGGHRRGKSSVGAAALLGSPRQESGPLWIQTAVKRTPGWHTFAIHGTSGRVIYAIDGHRVHESQAVVTAEVLSLCCDDGKRTAPRRKRDRIRAIVPGHASGKKPLTPGFWSEISFQSLKLEETVRFSRASLRTKIPPPYAEMLDQLMSGWLCMVLLPPIAPKEGTKDEQAEQKAHANASGDEKKALTSGAQAKEAEESDADKEGHKKGERSFDAIGGIETDEGDKGKDLKEQAAASQEEKGTEGEAEDAEEYGPAQHQGNGDGDGDKAALGNTGSNSDKEEQVKEHHKKLAKEGEAEKDSDNIGPKSRPQIPIESTSSQAVKEMNLSDFLSPTNLPASKQNPGETKGNEAVNLDAFLGDIAEEEDEEQNKADDNAIPNKPRRENPENNVKKRPSLQLDDFLNSPVSVDEKWGEEEATYTTVVDEVFKSVKKALEHRIDQCEEEEKDTVLDGHIDVTLISAKGFEAAYPGDIGISISVPGPDGKLNKKRAAPIKIQEVDTKWTNVKFSFKIDPARENEAVKIHVIAIPQSGVGRITSSASLSVRDLVARVGRDGYLNLKDDMRIHMYVKHVTKKEEEMESLFGDDGFNIIEEDDDEILDDDPDKVSMEEAKRLNKGLDSLVDDLLYVHAAAVVDDPDKVAFPLLVRMARDYHKAIYSKLRDHTNKFKLHTICSLQLLSWVNSYLAKIEYIVDNSPADNDMKQLRTDASNLAKEFGGILMQRYVVFRGLQQNALVERLISGEEEWELPRDTRIILEEGRERNYVGINTPAPASLFTLIDSSIEMVGTKYRISGQQLTKEVEIQLRNLTNYTVTLSILYDRVSFPDNKDQEIEKGLGKITEEEEVSIFDIPDGEAEEVEQKFIRLAYTPKSNREERKSGFLTKDYYWLIAQVNNFELFKKYAEDVCNKLNDRHVVDVEDYKRIQKDFAQVVLSFRIQAERCVKLLSTLAIRNCKRIYDAFFTERWASDDCKLMRILFKRISGCLTAFTDVTVMASDAMARQISDQCILNIGIEYMREIGRKDIGKLPEGMFKKSMERDLLMLMDMLDHESPKIVEKLRRVLCMSIILSVPPEIESLAYATFELKTYLQSLKAFTPLEIQTILLRVISCRKDLDRSLRYKVENGIKNTFDAKLVPEIETKAASPVDTAQREWVLQIDILRGTGLAPKDVHTSDPYVVLKLLDSSGERIFTVKTSKMPKTLNPIWNHSVSKITPEVIKEFHTIHAEVWDHDYVGYDDFMGQCQLTRSVILEEIRNVQIKNPNAEEGTATFELKLEERSRKKEEGVSGSITVRIKHAEILVKKNEKRKEDILNDIKRKEAETGLSGAASESASAKTSHRLLPDLDSHVPDDHGSKKPPSRSTAESRRLPSPRSTATSLDKVFKGGSLMKKERGWMRKSWQPRYFEVRDDGTIAWGKGDTKAEDWKAYKIRKVISQRDMSKNQDFEFEIHVEDQKKPLVLRASDQRRFKLWINYLDKVCDHFKLRNVKL